jgi:hypothetical protein
MHYLFIILPEDFRRDFLFHAGNSSGPGKRIPSFIIASLFAPGAIWILFSPSAATFISDRRADAGLTFIRVVSILTMFNYSLNNNPILRPG